MQFPIILHIKDEYLFMKEKSMEFGEKLRIAREKKHLKQKEAAKILNIANSQLSRYESEQSSPTPRMITELVKLYDVSPNYLFGFEKKVKLPDDLSSISDETMQCLRNFEKLSSEEQSLINQLIVAIRKE